MHLGQWRNDKLSMLCRSIEKSYLIIDLRELLHTERNLLDLNATVESMIRKADDGSGKYLCLVCGKTSPEKTKAKRHAEIHLNMTHPCIVCGKNFKTRNTLGHHYTQQHPNEVMSPWTTS